MIRYVLIAACLVAGCTPRPENMMTAADIKTMVTGNTFQYFGTVDDFVLRGTIRFNANGNLFLDTNAGPDGGVWRTQNDQLCTTLVKFQVGQETCFHIIATTDTQFITTHGFRADLVTR